MNVYVAHNFLTEQQCQELIQMANPRLSRSRGMNSHIDGSESISDYRTSNSTFLVKGENSLVADIEQRIVGMTRHPIENQEAIQIAHYPPGTYYQPHWDYVDPAWGSGTAPFLSRGGNRMMTVMIYLNTIPEGHGGETHFDQAGVLVRPETGKVCIWYNLFPGTTKVDPSTKHEGRPPKEPYEKWIATIWIRERVFT